MKKKLLALLLAACLVVLCGVTAVAEGEPAQQEEPSIANVSTGTIGTVAFADSDNTKKTLTVEYAPSEALTDNDQYLLLVLRGDDSPAELSVDSILYIDQVGAANGKADFGPLQLKSYTTSKFYVAGGDLEGPTLIGTLTVPGVDVSGTIKFHDAYSPATVTLTDKTNDSNVKTAQTANNGTFTVEKVPTGNYTLKISKPGYADATKDVTITGDPLGTINIEKFAGDVEKNGAINLDDLQMLLDDFGRSNAAIVNRTADINGSSSVNLDDLQYLIDNFGTTPKLS